MQRAKIVFSDLDGTILDKNTYSYNQSLNSIHWLKENSIPLIFCSAKTRAEMESLRNEIGVKDPYIVENGSAIIIPKDYFSSNSGEENGESITIEIGARLENFRSRLTAVLESRGIKYESFAEMTNDALSKYTGLTPYQAELARKREYTMTLIFPRNEERMRARAAIESIGLNCFSGSKTLTIGDGGNKGSAVRKLSELYAREYQDLTSYAFGDGENDMSMLNEVDFPILVQNAPGKWTEGRLQRIIKIPLVGPEGFAKGVAEIVGS